MKYLTCIAFPMLIFMSNCQQEKQQVSPISLAERFLQEVKTEKNSEKTIQQLAEMDLENLEDSVKTDDEKLAFWINIYNATTQYSLRKNPAYFEKRSSFYKTKLITLAGEKLSLDEIEHGILRRNISKYSFGYVPKLTTRSFLRRNQVKKVDPRIHFSLNCGAKSCPPVFFFEVKKIQTQLELSTASYLEIECEKKGDSLFVPVLFSWFRGDFGGKKGIYAFLENYQIISKNERPTLVYKPYDWELMIGNYK